MRLGRHCRGWIAEGRERGRCSEWTSRPCVEGLCSWMLWDAGCEYVRCVASLELQFESGISSTIKYLVLERYSWL